MTLNCPVVRSDYYPVVSRCLVFLSFSFSPCCRGTETETGKEEPREGGDVGGGGEEMRLLAEW